MTDSKLQENSSPPPLTFDNVFDAIKGIKNDEYWFLFTKGLIANNDERDDELSSIRRKHHTLPKRIRATAEAYMKQDHEQPPWRWLIYNLYMAGELQIADNLLGYAEPPEDATLTVSTLKSVLESVKDLTKFTVKLMPTLDKWRERLFAIRPGVKIGDDHLEYVRLKIVQGVSHFYVTAYPWASWLHISEMLHQCQEFEAVKKCKTFSNSGKDSDKTEENQKHFEAYQRALRRELRIKLKYLKLLMAGPPRSGKTTMRQRLVGELINLLNKDIQPSTGTVESHKVLVKLADEKHTTTTAVISGSNWSTVKDKASDQDPESNNVDLDEELHLLYQLIVEGSSSNTHANDSAADKSGVEESIDGGVEKSESESRGDSSTDHPVQVLQEIPVDNASHSSSERATESDLAVLRKQVSEVEMKEIEMALEAFYKALQSRAGRKELKGLLEKTILLNMVDTGGQPAFMEMLPTLTIGPALYLIFLRLDQDLKKRYQIEYHNDESEEIPLGESSYTIQEVIFKVISSIACFSSGSSHVASEEEYDTNQSRAVMLVGTYKDKLQGSPKEVESKVKEIDDTLKDDLEKVLDLSTQDQKLLRYAYGGQLMFDVDNLRGGEEEMKKVRKRLEKVILEDFNEVPIPASWLMFSIFLRKMGKQILSMSQCEAIGRHLKVKDVREALWFLHHCIGIFMHYPEVEEMKDVVICDPQIIFDSVTKLILNTFDFDKIGDIDVCKKFKQAGQFKFNQIQKLSKSLKTDVLSLPRLVKLLEYLNIIAPISSSNSSEEFQLSDAFNILKPAPQEDDITYFMPAVLASAQEHELSVKRSETNPPPLMIRFKGGFVPFGVFCAMVARLVAQEEKLGFVLQKPGHGRRKHVILRKNRVTFRIQLVNGTYDVTLISKPKRLEVHVILIPPTQANFHNACNEVLETICNTLDSVISQLSHKLSFSHSRDSKSPSQSPYQIGFRCPLHDDDHMIINTLHWFAKGSLNNESVLHQWYSYLEKKTAMICLTEDIQVDLSEYQLHMLWFKSRSAKVFDASHVSIESIYQEQILWQPRSIPGAMRSDFKPQALDLNKTYTSALARWGLKDLQKNLNGEGITIAILDSGIDVNHKAFKAAKDEKRLSVGSFFPDNNTNEAGVHGSMAAFVAAGEMLDDGVGGIAPKANLLICRVSNKDGLFSDEAIIEALDVLIKAKKPQKPGTNPAISELIVSMSFGSEHDPKNPDHKKIEDRLDTLKNLGALCVAAVGNYGNYQRNALFPACLSGRVLSVGALSDYGHSRDSNPDTGVDVFAPGEGIAAPAVPSTDKSQLIRCDGSSCAAPAIAGLLALLLQYARDYKPEELESFHNLIHLRDTIFGKEMKRGDARMLYPAEYFKDKLPSVPTLASAQPSASLKFDSSMKREEFRAFLESRNLAEKDIKSLEENEVTAEVFIEIKVSELKELSLSFGGKKTLEKLLKEIKP